MAGFTPDAHIMWSSMKEMNSFQRYLLDIFHAYEQKSGVDVGSLKVFVDDTSSTELLLWIRNWIQMAFVFFNSKNMIQYIDERS